ncbi:uncharacterized protein EDB91DRAFT_506213 [Suillus paluster]|uniref:uncharacterized protein n=1 Tax=Suillus paluster TaxID=48578 RepID=UPI001B863D3E|nr:uncharacterized protein EDB91DRAFT_506213 [Suillus paluster]KAG1736459.1 hypothetical protein EDB91DRAFT_506213 [Suillus paluster]
MHTVREQTTLLIRAFVVSLASRFVRCFSAAKHDNCFCSGLLLGPDNKSQKTPFNVHCDLSVPPSSTSLARGARHIVRHHRLILILADAVDFRILRSFVYICEVVVCAGLRVP